MLFTERETGSKVFRNYYFCNSSVNLKLLQNKKFKNHCDLIKIFT